MTEPSTRAPYRIVVGVDFDKPGDDALAEALRMARENANDELHVVHVVKMRGDDAKSIDRAADEMQARANELRVRVVDVCATVFPNEEWEQELVYHVRLGDPADALHQVAIDYEANLVVVGTHARSGIEKLLLGSVAEKLVRIAQLPVLVARPRNFGGSRKSSRPEAPRPGEVLHDEHYHASERVTFRGRGGHISGLV